MIDRREYKPSKDFKPFKGNKLDKFQDALKRLFKIELTKEQIRGKAK